VWAQGCQQVGTDRWYINGIDDDAFCKEVNDLSGYLYGDIHLGVAGGGTQVRGADDLFKSQQWIVDSWWFFREDINRGSGHASVFDRLGQCHFIDQTTSSAVDDMTASLDS